MKNDFKENRLIVSAFWVLIIFILGVCAYYMIHNAYWLIGDEAIVISHTGMGIPFSPFGFDGMVSKYGRLYPFAYNLYNVLLLFHTGYISPKDHYILHFVALLIYALAFSAIAFMILREKSIVWKYAITLCFVTTCIARVYPEFITCYTGAWIIFMFLPVFFWSVCKFNETDNWGYGAFSLLVINYINYCYEIVFIIPFTMGACSLLFNYKKTSKNKRLFSWLLVASGVLFLVLYAIIVLPRATSFYGHYVSDSIVQIALKILVAQKIYWIALLVLVVRVVEVVKQKSDYTIYDSLLLSAFAYFCGSAILRLEFTYYYNIGSLTALVSVLHFFNEKLKSQWILILMAILAVFYCRKMPSIIKWSQKCRVDTYVNVANLSKYVEKNSVYWYSPEYEGYTNQWVDERYIMKWRLEIYLSWILHQEVHFEERSTFDENKNGVWLFPSENMQLFPEDHTVEMITGEQIFNERGIIGYYL